MTMQIQPPLKSGAADWRRYVSAIDAINGSIFHLQDVQYGLPRIDDPTCGGATN